MAALGTQWADGAWIVAGWVAEAWAGDGRDLLADLKYPQDAIPLPTQRFQDFINTSGAAVTGCLQTDYRNALFVVSGASGQANDYQIDDIFEIYYQSL